MYVGCTSSVLPTYVGCMLGVRRVCYRGMSDVCWVYVRCGTEIHPEGRRDEERNGGSRRNVGRDREEPGVLTESE